MEKKSSQRGLQSMQSSANIAIDRTQEERLNQIVHVDTSALLQVIRDLENKLSEHQRQDKLPPWAASLEARLTLLEKLPGFYAEPKVDPIPQPEATAEAPTLNLRDMVIEDRIISKIRHELDSKLESAVLNYDSKLSTQNMEMDRLHKLLQIRPTTSELQQVIYQVQEVERNSANRIGDITRDLKNTLQATVSTEMTSLLDLMKSSKELNDQATKIINNKVLEYAVDIADLKGAAQSSLSGFQQELQQCKVEVYSAKVAHDTLSDTFENTVAALNISVERINADQRATHATIEQNRQEVADMMHELENRLKLEQEALARENTELNTRLVAALAMVEKSNENFAAFQKKMKDENELAFDRVDRKVAAINTMIEEQETKFSAMNTTMQQFVDFDVMGKITILQDAILEINKEIQGIKDNIRDGLMSDIKTLNGQVHQLDEQCNKNLPKAMGEQQQSLDKLYEVAKHLDGTVHTMKLKQEGMGMVLETLHPVLDDIRTLQDTTVQSNIEINSIKETMTSTIDNNDELLARLGELEENFEQMDNSITTRMNRIRDSLMDSLVERQSDGRNLGPAPQQQVQQPMQHPPLQEMPSFGSTDNRTVAAAAVASAAPAAKAAPVPDDASVASAPTAAASAAPESLKSQLKKQNTMPAQPPAFAQPAPKFNKQGMAGVAVVGSPPASARRMTAAKEFSDTSPSSVGHGHHHPANGGGSSLAEGSLDSFTAMPSSYPHSAHNGGGGPAYQPHLVPRGATVSTGGPSSSSAKATSHAASEGGSGPPPRLTREMTDGSLDLTVLSVEGQQVQQLQAGQHLLEDSFTGNEPEDGVGGGGSSLVVGKRSSLPPEGLQSHSVVSFDLNPEVDHQVPAYQFQGQAQYIADMCLNYENISFKKRRVTYIPPVLCESIAQVCQELAETMANNSDYEMIYSVLCQGSSLQSVSEIVYDENFIVNRRNAKMEEYIRTVTSNVYNGSTVQTPGIVRQEARMLFITLVKKALEMFMTKHNQVLVVGNSRLGKIHIPSCIACDRPLVERVS